MTKFVISKSVPDQLSSYEMRIDPPNLLQEVQNCWHFRPVSGLTGIHWLRQIANEVTKWDKNFNPYRHISPSEYQGIPFSSPEEAADIAMRMITERYSNLTDAWVEHCIKHKPPFTKLIWFTGSFKESSKFTSNFIDRIEPSEVEEYMGRHAKKTESKVETPALKPQPVKNAASKKKSADENDILNAAEDLLK